MKKNSYVLEVKFDKSCVILFFFFPFILKKLEKLTRKFPLGKLTIIILERNSLTELRSRSPSHRGEVEAGMFS